MLHRTGTAQAPIGELFDGGERRVEPRRRSTAIHPAPARREIRFRRARVGDDRRVEIERCHRRNRSLIRQIAIDLVGEHHEAMFFSDGDELATDFVRIERWGYSDRSRRAHAWPARSSDGCHRDPAATHGSDPCGSKRRHDLREHRGIQRIGRRGDEDRFAFVDDGRQRRASSPPSAGGDEDAIGETGHAARAQNRRPRLRALRQCQPTRCSCCARRAWPWRRPRPGARGVAGTTPGRRY